MAVIVTAGVASGFYIGSALIQPITVPIASPDQRPVPTDNMSFTFGTGDLFPLEDCVTVSRDTTNFENLLVGKPTLLVFASVGCQPCEAFFNFFATIEPKINQDIQTIVCFADVNQEIPESYNRFLANKTVLFVDTHHFLDYYNVNVYPSLVAIDANGLVVHVQYVPTNWLDREIAEEFTSIDLRSMTH